MVPIPQPLAAFERTVRQLLGELARCGEPAIVSFDDGQLSGPMRRAGLLAEDAQDRWATGCTDFAIPDNGIGTRHLGLRLSEADFFELPDLELPDLDDDDDPPLTQTSDVMTNS